MPLELSNGIISEDMGMIFSSKDSWEALRGSKVFITGAAGMIASYLVLFFIYLNEIYNYNIEIYAGIRNKDKAAWRFGKYLRRAYFHLYNEDVNEPVKISSDIDYIFHAASLASPQFYGSNPVETMLPNIVGTNEILKFAVKHKVKKFIFFSSGAVYGTVKGVGTIKEDCVGDLDFLAAGSAYGESKRCGEALCLAYCREYGVPVNIIRINHTYGPTLDLKNDRRAFAEFVKNIIDGHNIELKSAGLEKRAFCYLSDATEVILKILLEGATGECYNLANEEQFVSIKELAEILVGLYPEKELKVIYKTRNEEGYLSLAQTSSIPCSSQKIKELGCQLKTDIKTGFDRTIKGLST